MLRKLFLSFWVTAAAIALVLLLAYQQLRGLEERMRARSMALVASARRSAEEWERGDRSAAAAQLGSGTNVLDADGRSIGGLATTPSEVRVADLSARAFVAGFSGPIGDARLGLIAQTFTTASNHRYTVITRSASNRFLWFVASRSAPVSATTVALLLGGIACFLLARHFAHPLSSLGTAVNAVADGNLEARVPADLERRRDELGVLARDFNRMAERIEALVAGQRRLLGDISHELRSPLARLAVALSLQRRESGNSEYLDRIERDSSRLELLVGQLLTLARIDSGVEVAFEDVDLLALVQEITADGDFEARGLGRSVALHEAEPCTIRGNAELLRAAIENVVRNAIRHTASETVVSVSLAVQDRDVHIRVRDRGDGLDEAILDHLFEPFRSSSGSTGLGLAIAARVVRMHGGSISASAAEGGGVQVEITLSRPNFT